LIAWVASALVGVVVFLFASAIVGGVSSAYSWGRLPDWGAILFTFWLLPAGVYASAFAFLLVLQFAYGGLLYWVLRRLGLYNLPLVLLAYLAPITGLALSGAAAPQIANAIPLLACGTALAAVGWFLAPRPRA
jgi:hypothetical protein